MVEVWKDVVGYEGSYLVSNLGRIKSFKRKSNLGRIMSQRILRGYKVINLHHKGEKKSFRVHRLVLAAFTSPQPNLEVRHLDGNSTNNCLSNLAWGTRRENEDDKLIHGTLALGSRNGKAILSESDVLAIRSSTDSCKDLSIRYGTKPSNIRAIKRRENWKHI